MKIVQKAPSEIVPAYAGQFLKEYEPHTNFHSLVNDLFTKTTIMSAEWMADIMIPRDVQFPDVSFYQGLVNWDVMSSHTKAIILRVGQATWLDPQFEHNYAEAKKRGTKVGVYFFYDDRSSPGVQAQLLINSLRGKQIDMEVFFDWENTYGGSFAGLGNVVAMMQAVEAALPEARVGIYTGYYWFRDHSNAITNASQYNYLRSKSLWLGWFATDPAYVLVPAPWSALTHWQFGTPVVAWGQGSQELDMNFCNCTMQEFIIRYGGAIAPPQEGGNVFYKATGNITIRSTPEIVDTNKTGQYVLNGDIVEADVMSNGFVHIINIYRNDAKVALPGESWCGMFYLVEIAYTPPPAPPILPDLVGSLTVGDDITYIKQTINFVVKPK